MSIDSRPPPFCRLARGGFLEALLLFGKIWPRLVITGSTVDGGADVAD